NSEIASSFVSLYTSNNPEFSSSTDFISEIFTTEISYFSETFSDGFFSSDLMTTFEPDTEIFTSEVLSTTEISSLVYNKSFTYRIYFIFVVCDVCPTLFLGYSNDSACRSTFGIELASRGFAGIVSSYTIEYIAQCTNNKTLTSFGLLILANAQITLLNTSFCYAGFKFATNFEDIDECTLQIDTCDSTKQCVNTIGAYLCICKPETIIDPKTCACQSSKIL
ncbi:hypothetical protein MXB_1021, partial [Myxobolus squamalis]